LDTALQGHQTWHVKQGRLEAQPDFVFLGT
jgi:hypothetical protein